MTQPLTALSLLIKMSQLHHGFWSTERASTLASNSEFRRWIEKGSLMINGIVDRDPKEVIDYPVVSIVIHPKSDKRRTTLR